MGLASRCREQFSRRDWQRGVQYFGTGAVFNVISGETMMSAMVEGTSSEPYSVNLDWSEVQQRVLLVDCSCPRFADVGICKHLAATILAADGAGIGDKIPGRDPLSVEPCDFYSEVDESDEWSDDDFEDDCDDDRSSRRSRNAVGGAPVGAWARREL